MCIALTSIAAILVLLSLLLLSLLLLFHHQPTNQPTHSLFNPTPSLSAMIMNHFKMGSRTINYNLGGMGCSASLVAVDLAKQVGVGVA